MLDTTTKPDAAKMLGQIMDEQFKYGGVRDVSEQSARCTLAALHNYDILATEIVKFDRRGKDLIIYYKDTHGNQLSFVAPPHLR